MLNAFTAVREVFTDEYESPKKYILWKTTGFGGIIKALPPIIKKGISYKTLTKDFFKQYFMCVKEHFNTSNIDFTAKSFGSGEASQKSLAKELIEPLSSFEFKTK